MRASTFKNLFESYEVLADQQNPPTKAGLVFAAESIRTALLEAGMRKESDKRIFRTTKKIIK